MLLSPLRLGVLYPDGCFTQKQPVPPELVALGINLSAFHKCAQSMLDGDCLGQLLARVVETRDALVMKVRPAAIIPASCL